ncbi:V-type ATP synthase subunit E [Clostridium vincentii]|uniref:V-type proton ATPase subunit E n=1 Tax=Clostridium vincentii TaxID=52704 RepID=A0A2T0BHK4_9CLOT|nr:V-type ATP synthase subunit E family protein [Clostridium vincentii]PRR83379.1 V-type ATP synthase subunit E [Clostridium vincentii]
MSNVSNLTSKILKDAEERKNSILAAAEDEKANILKKKNNSAKLVEATMLDKAIIEAKTRKERIISSALLKARNEKIKAKQGIIQEVFEKSIEELCNLSKDEFIAFLKNSILSLDISGDEKLILNEQGKKVVDEVLIKEINNELALKGKKGELTISLEIRDFKGGFILERNGIEINSTFEALVNSLRDELELEVVKELFG